MTNQVSLASTTVGKIWGLLSPKERDRTVLLLVFMFIGTGLELLGVGLVVPALALITQADYLARFPAFQSVLVVVGNPSQDTLVIGGMRALVAMYTIKAAFFTFFAWYQFRLAFGMRAAWSRRLFSVYLHQPYTFHLQRNSAQLIRNIASSVEQFTIGIFIPAVSLLIEVLVFLGLCAMLMVVEPLGTSILVCVLSAVAWGFHRTTRRRLVRWGEAAPALGRL